MRTLSEPPVDFLTHRVLRIKKGTYLSNYAKVFGAFLVSYVLHGYATHVAGGNHIADLNFFMSQAVAIWVEETVILLAKKLGIADNASLAKPLGYIWTFLFLAYSSMYWQDEFAAGGACTEPAFGFSVVDILLKT